MPFAKRKPTSGVVKPPKVIAPPRPSILELNTIFRNISRSSYGQHVRHLVLAMYWWNGALRHIGFSRRTPQTKRQSQLYLNYMEWSRKGLAAKTDLEKERCYVEALETLREYASDVFTVKSVRPYIKEYKQLNKKKQVQAKSLTPKFEKMFSTLEMCFSDCHVALKVVPDIDGDRRPVRRVSQDGKTMLYTRALAKEMLKTYRRRGLLPLAIDVAKQLAFSCNLETLLASLVNYCETNPSAPKRVVRNVIHNPIKPRQPRVGRSLPLEKSLNQQLLDDIAKEVTV